MKLRTRFPFILMLLCLAASLLTACTVSTGGGIVGAIVSVLGLAALFVGSATQTGCEDTVTACLSPAIPMDVGQDADADADGGDVEVQACLSIERPDVGREDADATDDATGDAANDATLDAVGALDADRSKLLAKMRERLPSDVAERLDDDELS